MVFPWQPCENALSSNPEVANVSSSHVGVVGRKLKFTHLIDLT